VTTVPRGAFSPPPKVHSAILHVKNISRTNLKDAAAEVKFFTLIKTGFAQKRKLLKRNLEKLLGKNTAEVFMKAGIGDNARAEDVSLAQWLTLAQLP
jgi:16S rRNA (adenine1518-N6/adenine1519-N6)-dimethyltransferase